jgi:SAM-dependent methyltransferase
MARGQWNWGWCPICERSTVFVETGTWLRDEYKCVRCRSIPRWRALIAVLGKTYPRWRELEMHESSPAGPASKKLSKECHSYSSSQFFSAVPLGDVYCGERCESLEALTFSDKSFDLFITQDVMEHVLRPDLAVSEIARVLRPGGAHVFTVPIYRGRQTLVRAEPGNEGEPRLLMEADYHGSPVGEGRSLVIREWGDDFVGFVERFSGLKTDVFDLRDRSMGLDGEFLQVFVTRKL